MPGTRVIPVALFGQAATIAASALTDEALRGLYKVHYILNCTTLQAGAATAQVRLTFTGDRGATTVNGAALTLTALGRDAGVLPIEVLSGNINWEIVTTGIILLGRYSVRIWVEAV